MTYRSCIVLLVLLLTACGGTPPTASIPAPQHTPLAQIDLEALVLQADDLPPMKGTPEALVGPHVDHRPGVATSFVRYIKDGDYVMGSIDVTVYTNTVDTIAAYDLQVGFTRRLDAAAHHPAVQTSSSLTSFALGDAGIIWVTDDATTMEYRLCHALVSISLPASRDATLRYADRLHARLVSVVCLS